MSEIEKLVEKLRNPKAETKYEACELLRVAPIITPEAIEALEKVLRGPAPAIVESATTALQGHRGIPGRPGILPSHNGIVGRTFQLNASPRSFRRFPSFVFLSARGDTRSDSSWISQ
jgi:hypothetical protein